MEAFVATGDFVEEDDVRIRFDGEKPVRQDWSRSKDHEAYFASNPRQFVNQLLKAKDFYMEYSPYDTTPKTLHFDVGGLRKSTEAELTQSFLECLNRDDLIRACGPGIEETQQVRLTVSYPPTTDKGIGLAFEFSAYGDDVGKLKGVTPIGAEEKEAYRWSWYGDNKEVPQVALRLVSASPGLLNQWQNSRQNKPRESR